MTSSRRFQPFFALAALCVLAIPLAAQQPAAAPSGGGAQTGTQPIGSAGQTASPPTSAPTGNSLGSSASGAQGVGTGPSSFQAESNPQVTTDRALLFPAGRDVQLSEGDLISVHLYGDNEYAPTARIDSSGGVLLPLIGVVNLKGLGITAAEQLIAKRLQDAGMFRDPQVIVQLIDGPSAFITVIGETHGVIPITGPRRLLDILAAAGGLPATASHLITIERHGQPALTVDLGNNPQASEMANVPVFPGDTIVVAHLGVVYIVGEFRTQGVIPLTSGAQLTLLQATALSGGPNYIAKYDDLHLIRTNGDKRTVVKLDIQKVLHGKAADPILRAGDIIFLPSSALKQAIQSGGLNAVLTFANLAFSAIAISR